MSDGVLVFGASGSTGRALLSQLTGPVWAASRQPRTAAATNAVQWLHGGLADLDLPTHCRPSRIASLGPLPDFTAWLQRQRWRPGSVVALSSASVLHKAHSPAAVERALATRMRTAERQLQDLAAREGFQCLVLRPTLIWGGGHCALSRLAALARRWHWLPRPWSAGGARSPLHHGDLAAAVRILLSAVPGIPTEPLLLGGGDTLPIGALVQSVSASAGARCLRVPALALAAGQSIARRAGLAFGEGLFGRWAQDQSVDSGATWTRLGHAPRGFDPRPADWEHAP